MTIVKLAGQATTMGSGIIVNTTPTFQIGSNRIDVHEMELLIPILKTLASDAAFIKNNPELKALFSGADLLSAVTGSRGTDMTEYEVAVSLMETNKK